MHQVPATLARSVLEMARQAGIPCDPLRAGLPSFKGQRHIDWDDYCVLLERLQDAVGGPKALEDLAARSFHTAIPREGQRVFGAFVSPKAIYRFMCKVLNPSLYPFIDGDYTDGGATIRIAVRVREGTRPCLAFMSASAGALRGVPCHLGLPPAEVQIEEMTDRTLVVVVRPPPSGTLVARTRRAAGPGFQRAALWMMELFARRPPIGSEPAGDGPARVEQFRRSLGLTDRQAEVLAEVAAGRSNKEIAARLDCAENTVEFHVTQLLRKAGVDSRTLLIAKFWAGAT